MIRRITGTKQEQPTTLPGKFLLFAGASRPAHLVGAESCRPGLYTQEAATRCVVQEHAQWAHLCEWRNNSLTIVAEWQPVSQLWEIKDV